MHLPDFIASNIDPILDEWERYAKEIPAACGMDSRRLRDHARQMLETIVDDLRTPQSAQQQEDKSKGRGRKSGRPGEDSNAEKHASARARAGFTIEDLISEYRALRASVLRLWARAERSRQASDLEEMTRFNEAIDQAVAESVARYSSEVRQAQDIFLGMLGHDLRNPLGAINMSAQLLTRELAPESRLARAAGIIHRTGLQMSELIDDLLDFTRTRLGQGIPIQCAPTSMTEVARQAVAQACAEHPAHDIALDAPHDIRGQWDPARIRQVFSNLIGNAVKHGDRAAPITVVVSGDAETAHATVSNHGEPIAPEDIPHIFEPLHRSPASASGDRHHAGLGLGLYITQEIVHAHQGTVAVSSSREHGTTFTVKLPRRCARS